MGWLAAEQLRMSPGALTLWVSSSPSAGTQPVRRTAGLGAASLAAGTVYHLQTRAVW